MPNIEITVNETTEEVAVGVNEIVEEVTVNVIEGGGSDLSISEGSGPPSGDPGTGAKAYQNTDTGEWWRWNGSSWVPSVGSGSGDMLTSVYDPTNVSADAFSMDNMVEGADTKILTAAERSAIADNSIKIETIVSGDNIINIDNTDPQNPQVTILISGPYGNDTHAGANGVPVGGLYYKSSDSGLLGVIALRLT